MHPFRTTIVGQFRHFKGIISIHPSCHELIESYEPSEVLDYEVDVLDEKALHHEDLIDGVVKNNV